MALFGFLEGYKHYISAFVMMILGLGGAIDPSAANIVVAFFAQFGLSVSPATILMVCALIVVGLKRLQAVCELPPPTPATFERPKGP